MAYLPAGSMCNYILMWLTPQRMVPTYSLFTHLVKSVIKYYNVCDSEKPITKVKPGNWVCNLKIVCHSYVVEAKH